MLLDERGLKTSAFDPVVAAMLGANKGEEGFQLVAEANLHGHHRIEFRDWLYCLVKAPGASLRRFLIDRPGKSAESFVDLIEGAMDEEGVGVDGPPSELTVATVAPPVLEMLHKAECLARDAQHGRIQETVLTLALLETADEELVRLLSFWATEDGLASFKSDLRRKSAPERPTTALFQENGDLSRSVFDSSGWRFCKRLREDMASLGAAKVTTRHLLYSILGNDAGALSSALSVFGVNVKKDLHAVLSRELARPGRKRNDNFKLTNETLFASVSTVLRGAQKIAQERGIEGTSEQDIHRSFLENQSQELTRLFGKDATVDLGALRDYMRDLGPDEQEEVAAIQRFTIKEISEKINDTIFGQQEAVERIIPWIKRLRFGMPRDGRPAGVFLLLGPTGAGKTQMAKELARYVYGDESMIIFLEMGQFKSKEAMNQFIGAPPGYVGYGEGKLTNGLRDKPESVVLFDEIEKANIEVFDTLLRFADEGFISDPAGPVRDGRKCIIVMTTNAGQTWLRGHVQANPNAREDPTSLAGQLFEAAMKELESKGFRPEFLGRLDERITFLPFSIGTCRKIVDGVLAKEIAKLEKLKEVTIDVPHDVRDVLAQFAFDRSMDEGARGAPRAVNQFIVTPAIDILSTYQEQGTPLPEVLKASVMGLTNIVLEAV